MDKRALGEQMRNHIVCVRARELRVHINATNDNHYLNNLCVGHVQQEQRPVPSEEINLQNISEQ